MQPVNFEEAVEAILAKDSRYHREAYFFLREALDHTQKIIGKNPKNQARHVSPGELLDGIKDYALSQFGPMTHTVLEEWGIRECEDFGEIVFNMVEQNLLAKTEKDSREDFRNGYKFTETFREPFLPSTKKRAHPSNKKTSLQA